MCASLKIWVATRLHVNVGVAVSTAPLIKISKQAYYN